MPRKPAGPRVIPIPLDLRIHCRARRLPEPVPEHRFDAARRWRFDWAWPALRLAVEVEGLVYPKAGQTGVHGGRHVSLTGFRADVEKYAAAFVAGWAVLRVLPEHIRSGQAADWIAPRLVGLPASEALEGYARIGHERAANRFEIARAEALVDQALANARTARSGETLGESSGPAWDHGRRMAASARSGPAWDHGRRMAASARRTRRAATE